LNEPQDIWRLGELCRKQIGQVSDVRKEITKEGEKKEGVKTGKKEERAKTHSLPVIPRTT